jgi:hypothetical protein
MGATPINAIETRYAGCVFRSRTEARWAVFFDFIGTRWIYEAEGFYIGTNNEGTATRKYLPDFYLPDEDLWIEVKGTRAQFDYDLIAAAVIPHGGGLPGSRIMLLDAIPQDTETLKTWPVYWFRKGNILTTKVRFRGASPSKDARRMLATRQGRPFPQGFTGVDLFVPDEYAIAGDDSFWSIRPAVMPSARSRSDDLRDAYKAARSARFEHGQSGAR